MRQRVMIAMALACNPKLLIADEPTTALDVTIQAQILDLMRELKQKIGAAIMLITHDLGVVAEMAQRVVVMYAGRKVEEAPVRDLFRRPRHPYTRPARFDAAARRDPRPRRAAAARRDPRHGAVAHASEIVGCAFAPRCPYATDRCRREAPPLRGQGARAFRRLLRVRAGGARMSVAATAPLLEVEGLKKHFPVQRGLLSRTVGQVYAVDGVSFSIAEGETLGLVGESGCGKSTAGKTILKLIEPTAGTVKLRGKRIDNLSRAEMRPYRRELQVVFQDPYSSLNPRLSRRRDRRRAAWRISASPAARALKDRVVARLRQGRPARGRAAALSARILRRPAPAHRHRPRARAQPSLIVCDEPVSALDVSVQAQVINLLRDLQAEFRLSYLFVAHDLAVVEHISHRIAVMYLGKIVELTDRDSLFAAPLHPYTEALLSAVPVPDPDGEARAHHPRRRRAEPDQSAVGLPLPHPLPLCRAALQGRGAGDARGAARPSRRLPSARRRSGRFRRDRDAMTTDAPFHHVSNRRVERGGAYPSQLDAILSAAEFAAARAEISAWPGYAPTPLRALAGLAKSLGLGAVSYKDEGRRFDLGSFKALGGAYAVLRTAAAAGRRRDRRDAVVPRAPRRPPSRDRRRRDRHLRHRRQSRTVRRLGRRDLPLPRRHLHRCRRQRGPRRRDRALRRRGAAGPRQL